MTVNPLRNKLEWLAFILPFLAGVGIRIVEFLRCRSLWLDEVSVSLNIVNRSYWGLLQPLDYYQGAPIGFLWAARFLVKLFGVSELSLRGYSLLCGIVCLPIFFLIARRLYPAKIAWLVPGLLAFLPSMVRYSNEAKQYMGDVLCAGLLILATQNAAKGAGLRRWLILFIAGVFSLLFSHPALFVLAGCGSYLVLSAISRPAPYKAVVPILLVGAAWLLFLYIDYLLILRKLTENAVLINYWHGAYAPIPRSWTDLQWYGHALWQFVDITMGWAKLQWVMIVAITIGVLCVAVRRKLEEWMLLFPVGFVSLASSLSKYPFADRLILWLVPLAVLVICAGVDQLSLVAPSWIRRPAPWLAAVVLLIYPLYASFKLTFREPLKIEEFSSALRYLDKQAGPVNLLFYNPAAENMLNFYLQNRSWTYLNRTERRMLVARGTQALALPPEVHGRLWIVLAHIHDEQTVNDLIRNIGDRGTIVQRWQDTGAIALVVEIR
jgi:Dolichyl-phosphate-mannose-protein mannosyltransferase